MSKQIVLKINIGNEEAEQFKQFLFREGGPNVTFDKGTGQWSIGAEFQQDIFWLGGNWHLYKSQGYSFNKPEPGLDLNILYELEQLCAQWREKSSDMFDRGDDNESEIYDWNANALRRWLFKAEPMVRAALASALTPRELQSIERIEQILNNDHNPDAGHDWADCGEVDVPIVLDAVKRLNKLAQEYVAPKVVEGVEGE